MKNQYMIYVLWLEYFSFKRFFNTIIIKYWYIYHSLEWFYAYVQVLRSQFYLSTLFAGTENRLVKQVCILILDVTDFLSGYKSDIIIICLQGSI